MCSRMRTRKIGSYIYCQLMTQNRYIHESEVKNHFIQGCFALIWDNGASLMQKLSRLKKLKTASSDNLLLETGTSLIMVAMKGKIVYGDIK